MVIDLIFKFLVSFFVSLIIAFPIYKLILKLKVGQPILEYVDKHNSKSGTPTMGGIIFILGFVLTSLVLISGYVKIIFCCILFVLLNCLVGFYDDFLKIRGRKNEGLKPYQKIVFQFLISLLWGVILYLNSLTFVLIPFTHTVVNMGFGVIPIAIFLSLFFINSVNLTDGLDGLVSFITIMVSVVFACILGLILNDVINSLVGYDEFAENLAIFAIIFSGAVLGFIFYNCYPAKMFMGDTGSLAIGAFLISISFASGTILYLCIFGVMYIVSSVSVIIQVAYYKITKKRVFLMAPLHHHFELKGVHENRITFSYTIATMLACLLVIALELVIK
ncbi:MAG: phospho-N-acetylmuramoyl-pentapeptide-transferase [Clostridia bacterium]|nr:phospho-N-acetylmuramoyl-pentapeptide-transferase [Clostridia bacterium]